MRRWPYEIWIKKDDPNPRAVYLLLDRAESELAAVQRAREEQRVTGKKALVFLHVGEDQPAVMVWNDLTFGVSDAAQPAE
jgi:hypothetical protein